MKITGAIFSALFFLIISWYFLIAKDDAKANTLGLPTSLQYIPEETNGYKLIELLPEKFNLVKHESGKPETAPLIYGDDFDVEYTANLVEKYHKLDAVVGALLLFEKIQITEDISSPKRPCCTQLDHFTIRHP